MTTKETVRALLDRLPETCSIDDVTEGRVVPHAQVEAELRRKWLLGSAQ